ncbi:MAG: GNAT family N-acetyltransferase [Candidatus Shapirobacteria bacterium]|nr:GNAT family N-acetyltransferase [Candidatus Shapirobacteria bacterium]
MNPKIVLEKKSLNDVVKITKTIIEFDQSYDKKYFEDRIKSEKNLILVAYIDHLPVGYLVSYDRDKDGSFYCWMAGVDPKFRQLGVLTELMKHLFQWAKNHNYLKIKIKTRNNRREMLAFLVKFGFNFTEVEPRADINNNRIMLEKYL